MAISNLVAILIFIFSFSLAEAEDCDINEILRSFSDSYEKVNDYTAVLVKQERLRGILRREENILFKFKKPFQIYMKWLEGPGEYREVLYDPYKNQGKMMVKPQGLIAILFPVINIEPDHAMVKNQSRHTLKEAGIGIAIENLIAQCRTAEKDGKLKARLLEEKDISGRTCSEIELIFSEDKSYYAARILIDIDKGYNLPVSMFVYDWKDNLLEKAVYNKLELNPGLAEIDFDPKNPAYGFKR